MTWTQRQQELPRCLVASTPNTSDRMTFITSNIMRYYSAAVTTKDRIAWSNKDGPFRALAVSDSCSLRCGVWDQHGPQSFRLWFRAYTPNFKPNHYIHTSMDPDIHTRMHAHLLRRVYVCGLICSFVFGSTFLYWA